MPRLALFDLDNPLLDREAAFGIWARRFMESNGLPPEVWPIIEQADGDGLRPRDLFFARLKEGLDVPTSVDDLLACYFVEYPARSSVAEETIDAVRRLRTNGWKAGVVTNGPPSQQGKARGHRHGR